MPVKASWHLTSLGDLPALTGPDVKLVLAAIWLSEIRSAFGHKRTLFELKINAEPTGALSVLRFCPKRGGPNPTKFVHL